MKIIQGKMYNYTVIFEPVEEGGYVVHVPALPGCVTQGDTFEEAKAMAKDAIQLYIEVLRADDEEIPVEAGDSVKLFNKSWGYGEMAITKLSKSFILGSNPSTPVGEIINELTLIP